MEQPEGRRYFGAELLHYAEVQDSTGPRREDGLQLNWRRETLNYGELEADASLIGVSGGNSGSLGPATGSLFTMRQHDFALSNDWIMQNSLGVDRATADSLLANSYHIKLPSSLIAGVNSTASSSSTTLQLGFGSTGRLNTGQVQTFENHSGSLLTAGIARDFASRMKGALELVHVNGVSGVPDHQSVAGVLQYQDETGNQFYQGHVLADSQGATGFWADAGTRLGDWQSRYGVYRMDPGLLWTDIPMVNDQQGLYLRVDLRKLVYQLAAGVDYSDTNISNDPAVLGSRSSTLFLNGNRRLNQLTSIGGNLNMRDFVTSHSTTYNELRDTRLSVYTSHSFPIGTSRLQMELADIRNGANQGYGHGITWDQSWGFDSTLQLSSTLGYETERNTGNDLARYTAGVLVHQDFSDTLRWDADISWTRARYLLSATRDDSVNGSLSLMWQFLPDWSATLHALANDYNALTTGAIATVPGYSGRDRSLLFTVRYSRAGGRSYDSYGRTTGKTGYGSISGEVFYDENHDGIRQPNEPAAVGVYVYLDRRYQKATDRDGKFVFDPVPAGNHSISVAQEDLPLPWMLADAHPGPVTVAVRQRRFIGIALVRSDE